MTYTKFFHSDTKEKIATLSLSVHMILSVVSTLL